MKGDFSKWEFDPRRNFNGVLHQQGKVLLDSDWNAQTRITVDWQDQAARDLIGSGVAAVPASDPDSFKVIGALVNAAGQVEVTLNPGKLWADGLPVFLPEPPDPAAAVSRIATYLQDPPANKPIAAGVRDALILEVWRESLNGFQLPDLLIEPALGGPDTTERVHTAMALRLCQLAADDSCSSLADKIEDDFSQKGKLKVSLQPTSTTGGDCPVVQGGGYAGFEHRLYRLEVAQVNDGVARFKWSQFNGGLVGRGKFSLDPQDGKEKVSITANRQAIITSGLTEFYLEALQYDPPPAAGTKGLGYWKVTCGAKATLNNENEIVLAAAPQFGAFPVNGTVMFFHLWDDLRAIADFPPAIGANAPNELRDGIRLEFGAAAGANYVPGDYWVFPVRAGEVGNPQVLIDNQVPEGIHHHRVPLAILNWNDLKNIAYASDEKAIEDCRHVFRPLTQQRVCCTFLVGDGVTSHGDFDSIEEALDHLPSSGGEICLLPGTHHRARVVVKDRKNIVFRGCAKETTVSPRVAGEPIFLLSDCQHIILENLDLASPGSAIVMQASALGKLLDIRVWNCRLQAVKNAIRVIRGKEVVICDNKIRMLDREGGEEAIFLLGDDCVVERNDIRVVPPEAFKGIGVIPGKEIPPPTDACAEVSQYYTAPLLFNQYLYYMWGFPSPNFDYQFLKTKFSAPGGIQIASTSERITIRDCHIAGGYANGITLGNIPERHSRVSGEMRQKSYVSHLTELEQAELREDFRSSLYDIVIEGNIIHDMGLNGIGTVGFFNLKSSELLASVQNLMICRNRIENCLRQIDPEIPPEMRAHMGFGGISLADAEEVMIRDNRIENNGSSHFAPVSGIFILHGEKVDISDNRILNNGLRTAAPDSDARPGLRGGIVIVMSFKQVLTEVVAGKYFPRHDGIPAAKIHNNIITQPLGQALCIMAMGPVSVVGNQLTSQGADFRVNPLSALAGAVMIFNLGVSKDLLTWLILSSIKQVAQGNVSHKARTQAEGTIAFPEVAGQVLPYFSLPSGNVLFGNNQTTLDLSSPEINFALSSLFIFSLDDVSYSSNQSECISFLDIVVSNTVILGVTIRTNDNRFQEGLTMSLFSLFSYGWMNTTTANQATHCLHALGHPLFFTKAANKVIYSDYCETTYQWLARYFKLQALMP